MEFIKKETTRICGTTTMNEDAHMFCADLEAALLKACPDARGFVVVAPIYGPDSVVIRFVNCEREASKVNCNADNNMARTIVQNIGSPKLKLDRARYFCLNTRTDTNLRGKTGRQELIIKSLVKFFVEMSQLEPCM